MLQAGMQTGLTDAPQKVGGPTKPISASEHLAPKGKAADHESIQSNPAFLSLRR